MLREFRLHVALAAGLAFAVVGAAPPTPAAGVLPVVTVTVNCYSNPERTVVRNNRSMTVLLRTVGSIYRPYSSEPYYVAYRLAPGRTVTFYTGYAARVSHPRTLTRRYIYNNTVGRSEGARVVLGSGRAYVDRCG
jgi:hypothetical protein